jgi:hypothetical protein
VGIETGGNAINFWGPKHLDGCVVGWVEATNCSGGCVHEANGTWINASPPVTVNHGRHSNVNQFFNTSVSSNRNVPYDATFTGVVYNDCT